MKIKKWIYLVLILSFMLLTACSNSDATSEVVMDQHLIIGEQLDLRGYDPGSTMSDFIRALIFNNLVELDMNFEKTPGLATNWWMNEDATVWTFELREGVVFHDGSPWNAEAAKFNLDYRREGTGKAWLSAVDSVHVLDTHLLEVVLNQSVYTFDSDLTPPFLAMVSPGAIDEEGAVTSAIGTGPFKLKEWQVDQSFTLERNEDYFEGKPTLDKVTFKVIPDAETRAMALQNGDIHMMSGREGLTAVQRLKKIEDIDVVKKTGQTSEVIFMNTQEGPLSDINVRKAIALGIDLETMVPELLEDLAEAPKYFFSGAYGAYVNKNIQLPSFNQEEAVALLAESGYNENNPLSLRLVLGASNEEDKLLSLVIQNQLGEIGIDLELVHLEGGALRDALSQKDYDMIMIGQWLIPHDEPTTHYLRGYWHSDSSYKVYHTEELDAKIERLHGSLEAQERIRLHHEIQNELLEAYPVIVVFHRNNVMLKSDHVKNFEISTGTWQLFRGLIHTEMN